MSATWAIIPAAGVGSRIQPLAFSKELLPVGSRRDGAIERPRAVSEYLIERMLLAGADRICFVIAPGKSDIIEYYGGGIGPAASCYVVQPSALGLCDAIFRALPLVRPDDQVMVGLPDTIWFPRVALCRLPSASFSFLLFPTATPALFDAVSTDQDGRVLEIQVKHPTPCSDWIWGAFKLTGATLAELHELWTRRRRVDLYVGDLVNAYLRAGGIAYGVRAGRAYVDVGTLDGYRQAMRLLAHEPEPEVLQPLKMRHG